MSQTQQQNSNFTNSINFPKRNLFSVYKPESIITNSRKLNEGRWSKEEHKIFVSEVLLNGIKNWKHLEEKIKSRTNCQIRSHFQKYLKKLCIKYNLSSTNKFFKNYLGNLNEIHLDINKVIDHNDMKFIKIFNSYKKVRLNFRKKKMTQNYFKRLAKKKFFKVKKNEENICDNSQIEKIRQDSTKTNEHSQKNEISSPHENIFSVFNKLSEITQLNQIFMDMIRNNQTFNFETNFNMFRSHMTTLNEFLQK